MTTFPLKSITRDGRESRLVEVYWCHSNQCEMGLYEDAASWWRWTVYPDTLRATQSIDDHPLDLQEPTT